MALPVIGELWSTYDDDNNVGDDVDDADWIKKICDVDEKY